MFCRLVLLFGEQWRIKLYSVARMSKLKHSTPFPGIHWRFFWTVESFRKFGKVGQWQIDPCPRHSMILEIHELVQFSRFVWNTVHLEHYFLVSIIHKPEWPWWKTIDRWRPGDLIWAPNDSVGMLCKPSECQYYRLDFHWEFGLHPPSDWLLVSEYQMTLSIVFLTKRLEYCSEKHWALFSYSWRDSLVNHASIDPSNPYRMPLIVSLLLFNLFKYLPYRNYGQSRVRQCNQVLRS